MKTIYLTILAAFISISSFCQQVIPQISNIYPDHFLGKSYDCPRLITGENLLDTEIYTWSPDSDEASIEKGLSEFDNHKVLLQIPPKGAVKIPAIDIENQVITAYLDKELVWIKKPGESSFSKPYLLYCAKPYWISREVAEQNASLHIFGEGLKTDRKTRIVLKRDDGVIFKNISYFTDTRVTHANEKRLIHFNLPQNVTPGNYKVLIHNGYGGNYGWSAAGDLKVVPTKQVAKRFFVTAYGAKGDGFTNDFHAIKKAIEAVRTAGGGEVAFIPGTYLTDETIEVPANVYLVGADKGNTVIRGIGFDKNSDLSFWWLPQGVNGAYSLLTLTDNTGLRSLTLTGAVSKGSGGYGMIRLVPEKLSLLGKSLVSNITIDECNLNALTEDIPTANPVYRACLMASTKTKYVTVRYSDITGTIFFQDIANRAEIISNRFTKSVYLDVVSLYGKCKNSFVDSNIFTEQAGRVGLSSLGHSYFRFNEVRGVAKGTWNNTPEPFLIHGATAKTVSSPTGWESNKLIDKKQNWVLGQYKGLMVVIGHGKGFGQYRKILDNTANTLILEKPWNVMPDATSEYFAGMLFTENVYYGNINSSPGRMSLWLDCFATTVEMHRDEFAGGIDIWGQDRAFVDEKSEILVDGQKFYPSWYNLIYNNWFDGSHFKLVTGVKSQSVYKSNPLFGNIITGNKLRYSFMRRMASSNKPGSDNSSAISFFSYNPEMVDKAISSHTVLSDNLISHTPRGIEIAKDAYKTFILNNVFDAVVEPIKDNGVRSISTGNKNITMDVPGANLASIADYRLTNELLPRVERSFKTVPKSVQNLGTFNYTLSTALSSYSHPHAESEEAALQCKVNLTKLYSILVQYEKQNGGLPKAAYFPEFPQTDSNSLSVLLGTCASAYLKCPAVCKELNQTGLSYLWNPNVSGKKLKEIKDKSTTWLMVDIGITHPYLLNIKMIGHNGKVNVLFADGIVRAMSAAEWKAVESK